jgi:Icc protein
VAATVLQLSDLHFTREEGGRIDDVDPEEGLALVLEAWAELDVDADLVLLTGDNAEDGSTEALERLRDRTAVLQAPVMAIPGNHDLPEAVAAVFGEQRVAEVGGWRIVGVDTTRPHQIHGTIDVPVLADTLGRLDERPTVLALHHPPRSPSTHDWFKLEGEAALVDLLATVPHVRAVVSGHLHDPFDFETGSGTALLGCPSTFVAIGHDQDRFTILPDAPLGARVLHLNDDGTFGTSVLVVPRRG